MTTDDEPVSKNEFARLIGVRRSTVQKYLKTGKITADAVVGTGREAKVKPRAAILELRASLDPVRSRANLDDGPRVAGVKVARPSKTTTALRREQLRGLRLRNRRAEKMLRERGHELVRAADVPAAMRRLVVQTVALIGDDFASAVAAAVSEKTGLPVDQVKPWLLAEIRCVRHEARRRAL